MSKHSCDSSKKVCAVSDLPMEDAAWILGQLAMPFDARDTIKARRERAIARSGLSRSKGYRLWYGQVRRLWDDEVEKLLANWDRHIKALEQAHADKTDHIRAIREARQRERQNALQLVHEEHLAATDAPLASETASEA